MWIHKLALAIVSLGLIITLLLGCNDSLHPTGLAEGDSIQLTSKDGIVSYSITVLKLTDSYVEVEITPNYEGDYYFVIGDEPTETDACYECYDLVIKMNEAAQKCIIDGENIKEEGFSGTMMATVVGYPILIGNNNTQIVRLNFQSVNKDSKRISISLGNIIDCYLYCPNENADGEQKYNHTISDLVFRVLE